MWRLLCTFSPKKKKKLKNNNKNNPHISFQEKKFQDNSARLIAMGKMEVGIHHRIRRQRDYFFRAPYTDGFLLLCFAAPWAFVYILFNSSHLYYLPPHDKLNKWCISACWTASSWNKIGEEEIWENRNPLTHLGEARTCLAECRDLQINKGAQLLGISQSLAIISSAHWKDLWRRC